MYTCPFLCDCIRPVHVHVQIHVPYSPGKALPVKASNYAQDILAFAGDACLGDYSTKTYLYNCKFNCVHT